MAQTQAAPKTSGSEVVLYDVEDGVATLTLNRPDRLNAWTGEMETRYFDCLDAAAADEGVRIIVVTGAGKGFCAGADMQTLQDVGQGKAPDPGERSERLALHATRIPKPVIAAINGACAGIGFVHALMCDVRFAAAGVKFTTAFARRGLVAEHGSSWILPKLIGPARALDVLVSGRVFLAEEAAELGIVNRVFPKEKLLEETRAYAKDLAANCSPAAMATMKRQVYEHWEKGFEDSLLESNRMMIESLQQEDFREGVASFVEKRPPNFRPLAPGSKGYTGK